MSTHYACQALGIVHKLPCLFVEQVWIDVLVAVKLLFNIHFSTGSPAQQVAEGVGKLVV